jgi:integrase
MAAKVKWYRGAWWVDVHHEGKRKKKRIGPTADDKRRAQQLAKTVNARVTLDAFGLGSKDEEERPLCCDAELRRWHLSYGATMKPAYRKLTHGLIENHLAPHFGSRDLRELRESDLLEFVRHKLDADLSPRFIRNALSVLRRVCNLLVRDGALQRNPAAGIGELMRRVGRAVAVETEEVQAWAPTEIEGLVASAKAHEPGFAPFLTLLLSTGLRRGEALGLQWADVDFDGRRLSVRRAVTSQGLTTPKSGKARRVVLTGSLASELLDLLGTRRREAMARGWPEVPAWVFCSDSGTAPDPSNIERVWRRVRRKAQKLGVRPLKLHCTRHTWATRALQAGKSVRWVADQLGHADPALTLRVYAHAMREDETDLSFAEFGGPGRPYAALLAEREEAEARKVARSLARREGLEPPTLRFEA